MNVSALLAEQTGFTTSDVQRMHEAALQTLDRIGLAVDNPAALKRLASAGVRIADGRVFFAPDFVEEQLAQIRRNRDDDGRRSSMAENQGGYHGAPRDAPMGARPFRNPSLY